MTWVSTGSHHDDGEVDSLQIGKAAELRFASLAILGSGGALELVPPLADDERRDFEIHLKHRFGRPLSVQVKVASALEPGQHLHSGSAADRDCRWIPPTGFSAPTSIR